MVIVNNFVWRLFSLLSEALRSNVRKLIKASLLFTDLVSSRLNKDGRRNI